MPVNPVKALSKSKIMNQAKEAISAGGLKENSLSALAKAKEYLTSGYNKAMDYPIRPGSPGSPGVTIERTGDVLVPSTPGVDPVTLRSAIQNHPRIATGVGVGAGLAGAGAVAGAMAGGGSGELPGEPPQDLIAPQVAPPMPEADPYMQMFDQYLSSVAKTDAEGNRFITKKDAEEALRKTLGEAQFLEYFPTGIVPDDAAMQFAQSMNYGLLSGGTK